MARGKRITNERREKLERLAAKRLKERTRTWTFKPAGSIDETTVTALLDYTKTGCHNEMATEVQITVNGNQSFEADLYHSCSHWPACGKANHHCWVHEGHNIELAVDGAAFHVWKDAMVLFVDGRDVETGRTRAQYWRRAFLIRLVVSVALILVGGSGLGIYFGTGQSFVSMMMILVPFGLLYCLISSRALCRYRSDNDDVGEFEGEVVRPTNSSRVMEDRPLLSPTDTEHV